jgi:oligopeptide/dipeptide ABC transporter ATP-binding protein
VTIQAQIVQLLVELVRDRGVALVLITHDMGVVAQACDRVVVLYAGRVAESNSAGEIFAAPRHPYTKALIGCIPRDDTAPGSLAGIPGSVPSVARYPVGCRFHPRCPEVRPRCAEIVPPLERQPSGGAVACHAVAEAVHG